MAITDIQFVRDIFLPLIWFWFEAITIPFVIGLGLGILLKPFKPFFKRESDDKIK